jgi:predicted MFS family arabinose efflux permease
MSDHFHWHTIGFWLAVISIGVALLVWLFVRRNPDE